MKSLELKDLYKLAAEGNPLQNVTGVRVGDFDPDFISPPEGLKSIGLIAKMSDDESFISLDVDLIDICISYNLENVDILLEVPSHLLKKWPIKELLEMADNLSIALSILPPGHPEVSSDVTHEEYKGYMAEITDMFLNVPNFSSMVQPVSNYFTYLMLEVILKEKINEVFKIQNDYVIENFSSIIPEDISDDFKKIIKDKVYDFYGGKEGFYNVANVLINQVYDLSKLKFKDAVKDYWDSQNKENTLKSENSGDSEGDNEHCESDKNCKVDKKPSGAEKTKED